MKDTLLLVVAALVVAAYFLAILWLGTGVTP